MDYKEFKEANITWDGMTSYAYNDPEFFDKQMRKNWNIAKDVKRTFYSWYDRTSREPQKGDIVEYVDCNHHYIHGLVENVDAHGLVYLCGHGTSYTEGRYFSTSGGPFIHKHKSHFEFAGWGYRRVWTWGRCGAGAGQGIYFDILVKKFRQKDMPEIEPRHRIFFGSRYYADRGSKVVIEDGSVYGYIFREFKTLKDFRSFAAHVGLTYHKDDYGNYFTDQFLVRKSFSTLSEIPTGSVRIDVMSNGSRVVGYAHKEDRTITLYCPNPNAKEVCIPFEDVN